MADNLSTLNADDGSLGERLQARREKQDAVHSKPTEAAEAAHTPEPSTMADRLMARRAQKAQVDIQGESQGGEGEGSVGQEIAREPLFVGLGIRGHHHAGQKDPEAPPVKPTQAPCAFEDLGKPDPQPERARRPRM